MAPLWNVPDTYYERVAVKLEKHLSWDKPSFSRRYNLPSCRGITPKEDQAALHKLFRYTPPSCIIVHGLTHYLAVASFLQSKRLCIPDDISVIVCFEDPLLENIVPSIARFTLLSDDVILHAFHVLKEQMRGFKSQEQEEIIPAWVPGGSLAAPKSR
jgi:DNA-binding LacI/PurR family transcriptional regulator